jgi:hypothetical protein
VRIVTVTLWEKMLDKHHNNGYNNDMNIEMIIRRMDRVEEVLADCRSEWARNYWTEVWNYFHRQLKLQGVRRG